EQVFELLEQTARAKKCEAMEGLVKEAQGLMDELPKGTMVHRLPVNWLVFHIMPWIPTCTSW
ncbi:MAG: DUF892 family protein, partial [Chitinophagaceae bacterium]